MRRRDFLSLAGSATAAFPFAARAQQTRHIHAELEFERAVVPLESLDPSPINVAALRRAIGQMIMVGFVGNSNTQPSFRRVIEDLESGMIGGILFLYNNIQSKRDLEIMIREIHQCKCHSVPLIAIDEEGGPSDRLGSRLGFPYMPAAMEVGRGNEEFARKIYERLAQKLFDTGFNMNLAPVVDLNTNAWNPIIGLQGRSFSRDPAVVMKLASIFVEEHRRKGILTSLKHFPGHGSSSTDSHYAIANVQTSWSPAELIPYRYLIGTGAVDTIMIGHLAHPARWGGVATQHGSSAINMLLRNELEYEGVVISDDLSMSAIRGQLNLFPAAIRSAAKAGVDIMMVSGDYSDFTGNSTGRYVNSTLLEGVISGELEISSIEKSIQRIQALKNRLRSSTVTSQSSP